jgi:hypothetical protein
MQSIVFEKSPLSLQEYSAINWKIVWKTRWQRFIFILLVPAIIFVSALRNPAPRLPIYLQLLPAIIMPVALAIWIYLPFRKQFKLNYQNFPAFAEGATHTLTESDVYLVSTSTLSKQPWAPFYKKALLIDQWIVLYASATTGYFLDLRKLVAPATLADVEALFQSKGITLKKQ